MNQSIDLDGFDKCSKEDWVELVKKELKGEDPLKILSWRNDGKLDLDPIYFPEERPSFNFAIPGNHESNEWSNQCQIRNDEKLTDKDLNQLAMYGDGFHFIKGDGEISTELVKAALPCVGSVSMEHCSIDILTALMREVQDFNHLSMGVIYCDPTTVSKDQFIETLELIMEHKSILERKFQIITIPGNEYQANGVDLINEIGMILSALAAQYHILSNLNPNHGYNDLVSITIDLGMDYFQNIAKIRAIHGLTAQVGNAFNLPVSRISLRALVQDDNDGDERLIRETVKASSAIIGGCDSLVFASKSPDLDRKRISLNVGNLLREEAYLNRVIDPSKGSNYLEHLTYKIMEQAWNSFQAIEKQGGYFSVTDWALVKRDTNH